MPDYDAMADDYAAHPPTADEVLGIEIGPAALKTGRPRKGAAKQGRTPTMSVRLARRVACEGRQASKS